MTFEMPVEEGSSALVVLRHRPFGAIWIANVLSNIGSQVQVVAAAWTMATLAASPQMLALVQSASYLPTMLFALFAGAIADTYDRRTVMLAAQTAMMVAAILLAAFAYLDWLTPSILLTFIFLTGVGSAMNLPAWHSSVGDMLSRRDLPRAISLNAAGFNVARSIGPAVGGAIVAIAGAALAFSVNALSYGVLLIVLLRWRSNSPRASRPTERLDRAMRTGLGYVLRSPASHAVLLRGSSFSLGACAPLALLPAVVRDVFLGNSVAFGVLLGGFGLGAVSAALLVAPYRGRFSHEAMARFSISVIAAATFVTAVSDSLVLTGIALMFAGGGWSMSLTTFNTALQSSIPRWVVARGLALYQTGNSAGVALGSWAWGAIAAKASLPSALLVAAVTMLISLSIGLVHPLRESTGGEHDPAEPSRDVQTATPVRDTHGPVLVFVQYQVPRANIRRFKSLMAGQRRIRLRDGASQWSLLRDVQNPELWIEQYALATWSEYLAHRERRTRADQPLAGAIDAILKEGSEPVEMRAVKRSLARYRNQGTVGV